MSPAGGASTVTPYRALCLQGKGNTVVQTKSPLYPLPTFPPEYPLKQKMCDLAFGAGSHLSLCTEGGVATDSDCQ